MNNLLDPAILFFALGALAGAIKSNLEIPAPISRFLSLYLLMALGLKGGFALAQSGLTVQVASGLSNVILGWPLVAALGHSAGAAGLVLLMALLLSRSAAARVAQPSAPLAWAA